MIANSVRNIFQYTTCLSRYTTCRQKKKKKIQYECNNVSLQWALVWGQLKIKNYVYNLFDYNSLLLLAMISPSAYAIELYIGIYLHKK